MPDQEEITTPNQEAPELEEVGIREFVKHYFPDASEELLDAY